MSKEKTTVKFEEAVKLAGQPTSWIANEFPTAYANVVGMGITPFDISLTFGDLQGATKESVTARPLIKVTIPPELASILAHVLTEGLKEYVKGNGALRPAGDIHIRKVANDEG